MMSVVGVNVAGSLLISNDSVEVSGENGITRREDEMVIC